MKILHVIANLAPRAGGVPRACLELAEAAIRRGHEVGIYTTNADGTVDVDGIGTLDVPTDRPVVRGGVEIRYFPVQFPRVWATSLPLAKALYNGIPRVDLVHIHSLYFFHSMVAGFLCRRFGVPYIVCPHGSLDPYIWRRHRYRKRLMEIVFQTSVLRRAGAIHYTAEEERRISAPYAHNGSGVVVANGIDPRDFADLPPRGAFRARHPEIGDRRIVLFLGRVNFKKGLDILARAFGALAGRRGDVHLVVAGPDDGLLPELRRWLAESGADARCTVTGMLLGREKMELLADSDVFVLPSYSENFGIAVAEAMACAIPVVISNNVNIWREVENARAGRVVACDADRLTAALDEMLNDPEEMYRMGQNGRALVESRYTLDRVADQLDDAYRRVATANRVPA